MPLPEQPPAQQVTPTLASEYPWGDARAVMDGICFEAAYDAAGRRFVLRSAEDHIRFYDSADGSGLCRRPVRRTTFDFTGGRILAGLWSRGRGCTARYDVQDYRRDDVARVFTLSLRFVTEGGCDYELVRGFWMSLEDMEGYEVRIGVN